MTSLNTTEAKIVAIKLVAQELAQEDRRVDAKEVAKAAKQAYESVEHNS